MRAIAVASSSLSGVDVLAVWADAIAMALSPSFSSSAQADDEVNAKSSLLYLYQVRFALCWMLRIRGA
jgi:hypothetical protein